MFIKYMSALTAPGGPYSGSRGDGSSKSGGGSSSKMYSGAFQQVNRGKDV